VDTGSTAQGPTSRRAVLRSLPTPVDVELVVQDAPPLLDVVDDLPEPRIADLDALLREVDALRGSLRRDLSLAATAAESGADDLASWLLLGKDGEVRAFEDRALAHLAALDAKDAASTAVEPVVLRSSRKLPRMLPAAPMVAAAAAVIGFLTGVVPGVGSSTVATPRTTNSAMQSYARLTQLAQAGASPSTLTHAAERFHAALAPIVATAASNPAAAEDAIALLQSERAVIAAEGDSPQLQAVLAQADALVRRLQATLPQHPLHRVTVVPPVTYQEQRPSSAPRSTASAKPAPSPSPSAKPSPKPSPSPSRTGRPQPSPSASDTGPFPQSPALLH
jgi:hypothetical protein